MLIIVPHCNLSPTKLIGPEWPPLPSSSRIEPAQRQLDNPASTPAASNSSTLQAVAIRKLKSIDLEEFERDILGKYAD